MPSPVFAHWNPAHTAGWNRRALNVPHALHHDPLFSLEALAELIDRYPRSGYALVHTSRRGDGSRRWREGDIAGTPGRKVIERIAEGSLWLNLRDVGRHDARYGGVLQRAYAELAGHIPGFEPRSLGMGILISSPNAQVPYHCDLPGQALWQIHGAKRVHVYPAKAPFVDARALEDIAYAGYEFKLDYRPAFEAAAEVFELEPGGMLTWPLNAPHRVDNHDCLNVSVTSEHWTDANRRSQKVHLANAVLRHRLRLAPRSQAVAGPGYWAKAALQAVWRRSPWAASTQRAYRPVEFRLDAGAPEGLRDLPTGPA